MSRVGLSKRVALLQRLAANEAAMRQRLFRAPLFTEERTAANNQLADIREKIADELRLLEGTGALAELQRVVKVAEKVSANRRAVA